MKRLPASICRQLKEVMRLEQAQTDFESDLKTSTPWKWELNQESLLEHTKNIKLEFLKKTC